MLHLIVNLAVFMVALYFVANKYEESTVNVLLAGMCGSSVTGCVAGIILAAIALNPLNIVINLAFGLLNFYLFTIFMKRAGVNDEEL